jgi:hypothetical protein
MYALGGLILSNCCIISAPVAISPYEYVPNVTYQLVCGYLVG